MARIEGVPARRAGIMLRFAYWYARRRVGKVPEPMTVKAHHPWIFRGYGPYEFAHRFLDPPEFQALHDAGNQLSFFDRLDARTGTTGTFHFNVQAAPRRKPRSGREPGGEECQPVPWRADGES